MKQYVVHQYANHAGQALDYQSQANVNQSFNRIGIVWFWLRKELLSAILWHGALIQIRVLWRIHRRLKY